MANKLVLTPIASAAIANMMAQGYRAMEPDQVFPLLRALPQQRVCVVICQDEIQHSRELEQYHWVIFTQTRTSANVVMDAGLRDSHHKVTTKQMA